MRHLILIAALACATSGATSSVAEPVPPWCLKADVGADATVDFCHFHTFEQCARERFLYGTTSFCILNPHYYFRAQAGEKRPGRSRRGGER
jgi:hypothetical protein